MLHNIPRLGTEIFANLGDFYDSHKMGGRN